MKLGEYLKRNYFRPGHPAFLLGVEKLYKHLKSKGYDPTKSFLSSWLREQEAYSLHKDARRRFQTFKVIIPGPGYLVDCDLADMSQLADDNDSVSYLLVAVDAFSKKAAVIPLKNKTAVEVEAALRKVIEEMGAPKTLRHDAGKEFVNRRVQSLLKQNDIKNQTTTNQGKAHFSERLIGTLKKMIYKHVTNTNKFRYIDYLPDIVRSYNNTVHSTTGMKPVDVKGDAAKNLFWKMYKPKGKLKTRPFAFRVGDTVRLSYLTNPFTRSFDQHWTGEIFYVTTRYKKQGIPLYKVKDFNGEEITGTFYQHELQKVQIELDRIWKVEKVIKTRKRKGKVESLVRWLHWPEKYDSWVEDLQQL